VAEVFREQFGTQTNSKDCESKYNKDLKKSLEKELIQRWMENAEFPSTDDETRVILDTILILSHTRPERRLV